MKKQHSGARKRAGRKPAIVAGQTTLHGFKASVQEQLSPEEKKKKLKRSSKHRKNKKKQKGSRDKPLF